MKDSHRGHEKVSMFTVEAGSLGFAAGFTVVAMPPTLERLYVSPGHNFFGHHGKPAGTNSTEAATELHCLAGRGVAGDRFLDYKPDYAGQITFFEGEVFGALGEALGLAGATPAALRRNVVTRGLDLRTLTGMEFCVQGVWFHGAGECKPCYWMDAALAPGAESWLHGRGGLRARILSDGFLRTGPAELEVAPSLRPASVMAGISTGNG
jgi:MOSC domain-containing protein YiiM